MRLLLGRRLLGHAPQARVMIDLGWMDWSRCSLAHSNPMGQPDMEFAAKEPQRSASERVVEQLKNAASYIVFVGSVAIAVFAIVTYPSDVTASVLSCAPDSIVSCTWGDPTWWTLAFPFLLLPGLAGIALHRRGRSVLIPAAGAVTGASLLWMVMFGENTNADPAWGPQFLVAFGFWAAGFLGLLALLGVELVRAAREAAMPSTEKPDSPPRHRSLLVFLHLPALVSTSEAGRWSVRQLIGLVAIYRVLPTAIGLLLGLLALGLMIETDWGFLTVLTYGLATFIVVGGSLWKKRARPKSLGIRRFRVRILLVVPVAFVSVMSVTRWASH